MNAMKEEAIGGINAFLESQQKLPGEARLTLVLFDHEYIVAHDGVPIKDVPPLDKHSYVPRGTTALLDAIGRTINTIGERLDRTPEPDRPGKVIVAILTDGLENASQRAPAQRHLQNGQASARSLFLGIRLSGRQAVGSFYRA